MESSWRCRDVTRGASVDALSGADFPPKRDRKRTTARPLEEATQSLGGAGVFSNRRHVKPCLRTWPTTLAPQPVEPGEACASSVPCRLKRGVHKGTGVRKSQVTVGFVVLSRAGWDAGAGRGSVVKDTATYRTFNQFD
jgi:hypothetical protein